MHEAHESGEQDNRIMYANCSGCSCSSHPSPLRSLKPKWLQSVQLDLRSASVPANGHDCVTLLKEVNPFFSFRTFQNRSDSERIKQKIVDPNGSLSLYLFLAHSNRVFSRELNFLHHLVHHLVVCHRLPKMFSFFFWWEVPLGNESMTFFNFIFWSFWSF